MKNIAYTRFAPLIALVLLAACGSTSHDERPKTGSLARNFVMVGDDGRRYGTVEMDPVGGGKVIDADGRLIGRIVPPER